MDRENIRAVVTIPLHLVQEAGPPLRVRRKRGRPATVSLAPTVDEEAYRIVMAEDREEFISKDPVVASTIADDPDGQRQTLLALVREAAALAWDRAHATASRDIERISSRRVDALAKAAALVVEMAQDRGEHLPPSEATLSRLRDLWLPTVRTAAEAVAGPDVARTLIAACRERFAEEGRRKQGEVDGGD